MRTAFFLGGTRMAGFVQSLVADAIEFIEEED